MRKIGAFSSLYLAAALSAIGGSNGIYEPEKKRVAKPNNRFRQPLKNIDERKEDLHNDIDAHFTNGLRNEHWKVFEIHGFEISAYNEKNAIKTLNGLLRKHHLSITENTEP